MSSVINPVGPEDPKIYWRRRALVIGAFLLLLLFIWLISRGGSEGDPSATESSAPPPAASETAAPAPTGSTTDGEGTCADSDIEVAVEPDATAYPSGTEPQITLTIQNSGSESCTRNIGSDANSIQVSSGGVRVWSSDDCDTAGTADVQTLDPQAVASVTVPWPRTISAEGCPVQPSDQAAAQPGSYDVIGKNLDVKSDKVAFTLE
ncbi:MAG: hypothetical protein CMH41_08305 [Micrococcales bacterium]|nr:hypothetical protein [Micrococcales bacterium]